MARLFIKVFRGNKKKKFRENRLFSDFSDGFTKKKIYKDVQRIVPMDFFTTKIFSGKTDELVHVQFQKFSRGVFKNRAVILAKQSGSKYSISTTAEYANEFVRYLAELLGERKTQVMGVIVSTRNLDEELEFENKKQFMGIKQYVINTQLSGKEIISLCDRLPNAFMGLSFSVDDTELKVKPKAPKSAKPSTKSEDKPKADFCKIKTTDRALFEKLIFDQEATSAKSIQILHTFMIEDIIISDELKKEKDFALMREKAQRKGKLVRTLTVDGKEIVKKKEFAA